MVKIRQVKFDDPDVVVGSDTVDARNTNIYKNDNEGICFVYYSESIQDDSSFSYSSLTTRNTYMWWKSDKSIHKLRNLKEN